MSTVPHDELLASLKRLYENRQYSDLTIQSRVTNYQVHKAIVCPRSHFFSSACHDVPGGPSPDGEWAPSTAVVDLQDDDPHAVQMVVEYLYHLDYPSQPLIVEQIPHVNGYPKDEAGGDEDVCESPTAQHVVPEEPRQAPSVTSQEDRDLQHKSALVKQQKPGKKSKKKRRQSTPVLSNHGNGVDPAPDNALNQTAPEGDLENGHDDAAVVPGTQCGQEQASVQASTNDGTSSELVMHAKVFSLSQKYGIDGLKGLALEKFQKEAADGWDSHDFLTAVKEVYHSSMDECGDRRMREAVTDIVCGHPELLDKQATQDAIKDLQLNYDVLMRMRKNSLI